MKSKILICLAVALSFAACDRSTSEEDEEYVRLNDTYHFERIEFYLGENDGLSVTEKPEGLTVYNRGLEEISVGFKDEDRFSSTFDFEDVQPYTLVIDTTRKIRIPSLLENGILYMGQDETWTFRDGEPEGRLTGDFREHKWTIAPMHRTIVDHPVITSTITASFDAYFMGENTQTEVVMKGKWQGIETEHGNYTFVTDSIKD